MTPDDAPRVLTEQELQALRDEMKESCSDGAVHEGANQTKANDNLKPAFIGDEAGFFEPPMMARPKTNPSEF
jgi:hypothetical protein